MAELPEPIMKAGTFWVKTNSGAVAKPVITAEAKRRKYIVLNAWEHAVAKVIKDINPACKVFVYKCVSSTRDYDLNPDMRLMPAGVSYQDANRNHPDWFLLNNRGDRVQWSYPGHWQMDVGHPGYQDAWAANVARMRELGPWDGVWMDNCLWRRSQYSIYPRKYATDATLQNAYRSFVRNVTPKLRAARLISIGNVSEARHVRGGWNAYLDAGLDGGFDEWWISVSNGGNDLLPEYAEGWRRQVAEVADSESRRKIALVQPHFPAGATRAFGYTLASYLCVAGPNAAFTEANSTDGYLKPTQWHTEYDWDLGVPSGSYYKVTTNVFRRDFGKGTVVVNANAKDSSAVTVQLGQAYLNKSGQSVAAVSLVGCSGAILKKQP